jgi:hypothetical protein
MEHAGCILTTPACQGTAPLCESAVGEPGNWQWHDAGGTIHGLRTYILEPIIILAGGTDAADNAAAAAAHGGSV